MTDGKDPRVDYMRKAGPHGRAAADVEVPREKRDRRGRWKTGYSGNPRGRPRRQPIDESDEYVFGNALLKVNTPEGPKMISRKLAVKLGMFSVAAKGDKRMLMYLDKKFSDADEKRAEFILMLEDAERRRFALMKKLERVPPELEGLILSARRYLGLEP